MKPRVCMAACAVLFLLPAAGMAQSTSHAPAGPSEYRQAQERLHRETREREPHPTGAPDRDFVATMMAEQRAAIEQAKLQLRYGSDPKLNALAREVIRTRELEAAQFRQWRPKPVR